MEKKKIQGTTGNQHLDNKDTSAPFLIETPTWLGTRCAQKKSDKPQPVLQQKYSSSSHPFLILVKANNNKHNKQKRIIINNITGTVVDSTVETIKILIVNY
jgi:hypothetical protein